MREFICFCLDGIPASSISISSLDSDTSASTSVPINESALNEFNQQINTQANLRDYFMSFTQHLVIADVNSIQLQASSIAQLTGASNQITRNSAVRNHPSSMVISFSFGYSYWDRRNVIS